MKKTARRFCLVGKGILWIGFTVQIACGLIWMCLHLAQRQVFASVETGFYPLLVRLFGRAPQALYLMQLALACAAVYLSLRRPLASLGKLQKIWCVLAVLTVPVAMQCHLALLPDSFAGSLFLLELYFCKQKSDNGRALELSGLAKAGVCWVLLAGLMGEYVWLGALPPVLSLLFRLPDMRGQFRLFVYGVILTAAFGGLIAGSSSLAGRQENPRPFWFSMASRFAWPTLREDADYWSEGLREATADVLWEAAASPDNMENLLRPAVENGRDGETVRALYREMAGVACRRHLPQIAKQMAWDAATYAAPLSVLGLQLSGRGYDADSGANYEQMLIRHPLLAKQYVSYSCWWFFVSLAVSVLMFVCRLVQGEGKNRKKILRFCLAPFLSLGGLAAFYTLRGAGIADYKQTIVFAEIWVILALYGMGRKQYEEVV